MATTKTATLCLSCTLTDQRRSVREAEIKDYYVPSEFQPQSVPFSVANHRRNKRSDTSCFYKHILFVLDTSGSIGEINFNKVTTVLGDITQLFCSQVRLAVMTFDHEYYVEFCFNDYDNSACGRIEAGDAIKSMPYIREGQDNKTRWTHTAGAAQCVCNHMLDAASCQLDSTCQNITVVFVTDGHANDPTANICTEIDCLHDDPCVDTFVVAIGIPNLLRLNCMRDEEVSLDEYPLFNFDNFQEFENEFGKILNKLNDISNTDHFCLNPGEIIG